MQIDHEYCKGQILAPEQPVIICLHGFMGTADEWQPVIQQLPRELQSNVLYLSLPERFPASVTDIESYSRWLWQKLPDLQQPLLLVAYSLGTRIAMHWLRDFSAAICGAFCEAGHPGLPGDHERLMSDRQWQKKFHTQPLTDTLQQWYDQSVFCEEDRERAEPICQRHKNNAGVLGDMLLTLSVARQNDLSASLANHQIVYVTGESDKKYSEIAKQLASQHANITHHIVSGAGHNCHSFQPCGVSRILSQFLTGLIHEQS